MLNTRAIREARTSSVPKIEPEEQTSQAQEMAKTTETQSNERGFLPAAAFESAPPDLDQDYNKSESEIHVQQEEETVARGGNEEDVDAAAPPPSYLQEKMASLSMDHLNEPNSLTSHSPSPIPVSVPVSSRPTSPVGRTLSAIDMEDTITADDVDDIEDVPFEIDEPVPPAELHIPDVHVHGHEQRHLEIKMETPADRDRDVGMEDTMTADDIEDIPDVPFEIDEPVPSAELPNGHVHGHGHEQRHLEIKTERETADRDRDRDTDRDTDTSTKTSPVDVEFQGLPIRAHPMDENIHLDEFAEIEEEEEDDGDGEKGEGEGEGEHFGLPSVEHEHEHEHGGSTETETETVVEQRAVDVKEEFRGRADSLGIIHPPPAPTAVSHKPDVGRGVAEVAGEPNHTSSPESETSDYTPYSQPTPASPTIASQDYQTGAAQGYFRQSEAAAAAREGHPEADTGTVEQPNPNQEQQLANTNTTPDSKSEPQPEPAHPGLDQEDVDTVPSDDNADGHSISTASERGSYSDINEPVSPTSPTAAKAEEEDARDADFVPGQDVETQAREARILEGVGKGEEEAEEGKGEMPSEEVLRGLTGVDHEHFDPVESVGRTIDEVEDEWEEQQHHEKNHDHEHEQQQQQQQHERKQEEGRQHDGEHEQEQEQAVHAEAVEKEVLEKQVLQGFVDDPVGPAHDSRFELEAEAMRARGVLEPHASQVDLGEGSCDDDAIKYEEGESPVMGVEGVVEPPATPSAGTEAESEHEHEPEPVPVEELVKEQEEMGLGRPEPHDSTEDDRDNNEVQTTPVQILDMDRHPLDDHSHVSHVVGVALTHSDAVHMIHTPIEEGDHVEPAHYFVNQHHVPHSADEFYTPAEVTLRGYDHQGRQGHPDAFYNPAAHADDHTEKEHRELEREHEVPDVSDQVEDLDDTQPRYQLYERPYTPSDFAPTPMEASFHHIEHVSPSPGHDAHHEVPYGHGQPEVVVVTPQHEPDVDNEGENSAPAGYLHDHDAPPHAAATDMEEPHREGDEGEGEGEREGGGLVEDNVDENEIGHPLERVPSHQDVHVEHEHEESPGPSVSVDDFPMPGGVPAPGQSQVHVAHSEHEHPRGPEHYLDQCEDDMDVAENFRVHEGQEDDVENFRVHQEHEDKSESEESSEEDFEGRHDEIVLHHLDAIAEEGDEEVEDEVGHGVERRDMAEIAVEGHAHDEDQDQAVYREVEEGLSDQDDDVRSIPADESNVTLPNDVVRSDPEANAEVEAEVEAEAEAEAEARELVTHPQHEDAAAVESAPADIQHETYDTTIPTSHNLARQQTYGTEATEDSDADNSTEPSEPERIHEEGPDPRLSEEQPVLDEALELKPGYPVAEGEHAPHEGQVDEDHVHSQPGPEDDEYDPFRYSPPKKSTAEGQVTPCTSPLLSHSQSTVISSSASVKVTTSDSSAAHRDDDVNEAATNGESQEPEHEQTVKHVEDDVRVDDTEQPDVERPSDEVLSSRVEDVMLHHGGQAARSERGLAEELDDVGSGKGEDEEHARHYDHHGPEEEEVAVHEQHKEHAGRGYQSSDEEDEETLADDEANRTYHGHRDHHHRDNGHSHHTSNQHEEVEVEADAQPSQEGHLEPPVLQLIEPSDTSETSSISASCHPHAVTREEDMGRDWSEVDQFLSESESELDSEDEPARRHVEHVEEAGSDAADDTVAHAHPSLDVDIDAEVEAALETPAPEQHPTLDVDINAEVEAALETPATEASPAEDTAQLHEYYAEHAAMHHSPELAQRHVQEPDAEVASHDQGHHDQDNEPSTSPKQQSEPQYVLDEEEVTVTPAHHHDLPPLTIPATPPSPIRKVDDHDNNQDNTHDAHNAHDFQSPEEDQEFIPRDVTNRPWRSDTVNTTATYATADTTSNTVPTVSSPQSARSGTTLSSGPSSPVPDHEVDSGAQDPRIRDSIGANIGGGRARGLTDVSMGDYCGGGYGAYNYVDSHSHGHDVKDRDRDRDQPVPKGTKVMEMWHQREANLSQSRTGNDIEEVRLSGDSERSHSRNRGASGSGSGSGSGGGSGGGSSLFQRMRSVFEQSSSSSAPAAAAATSTNRVSMPSFFTKSHTPSPSQSLFENSKQRPMSTSPYFHGSRHRDGHAHHMHSAEDTTTATATEQVQAEEAGEHGALLQADDRDASSDDGYDEEYERQRERERQKRRERRRHEREKEEWRERHGILHSYDYGEQGYGHSTSRYDYGEYRPE